MPTPQEAYSALSKQKQTIKEMLRELERYSAALDMREQAIMSKEVELLNREKQVKYGELRLKKKLKDLSMEC